MISLHQISMNYTTVCQLNCKRKIVFFFSLINICPNSVIRKTQTRYKQLEETMSIKCFIKNVGEDIVQTYLHLKNHFGFNNLV